MGYALGVDLGTTYTAAGVYRDGRVEIASLGNRSAAIPSVVLLKADESILTGEAASRRGATEPGRVAREFKRRVGDTTPLFLGGSPYSAEALMAKLLRWVVDEVASREGGPADAIAICHPANWGPYKKDLLSQAVRLADLAGAELVTEPEAAAIHYASQERLEPGDVVAVYDLGGGTFDAAILRKTATGFEILGEPEGIERLGGIDFDAAVFQHVTRSLGGALDDLDEDDPTALAAVARLRQDCVDAKEALSTDTDTTIPVLLPSTQTEVRLTRGEFEAMIRPALAETIGAMQRALRSAGVDASAVSEVLLVGGSSRIPLVAQMVGAELARPVAVDAHPKHAIALGAALFAGMEKGMTGAAGPVQADAGHDVVPGAAAAGAGVGAAAVVGAAAAAANAPVETASSVDTGPPEALSAPMPHPAAPPPPAATAAPPPPPPATVSPPPPPAPPPPAPAAPVPQPARPYAATVRTTPTAPPKKRKQPIGAIIAALVVIAALGGGLAYVLTQGEEEDPDQIDATDDTGGGEEEPEGPVETVACPTSEQAFICLTDVTVQDDRFVVDFEPVGFIPDPSFAPGTLHFHVFLNPPTPPENAGASTQCPGCVWHASGGAAPLVVDPDGANNVTPADVTDPASTSICVLMAEGDTHNSFGGTGNCLSLEGVL